MSIFIKKTKINKLDTIMEGGFHLIFYELPEPRFVKYFCKIFLSNT